LITLEEQHTPKLARREKRGVVYPYYAGYSAEFVTRVVDQVADGRRINILDPWNGSGTTTFVASKLGHRATGLDLNPVLTVVARARQATAEDVDFLIDAANYHLSNTKHVIDCTSPSVALASTCAALASSIQLSTQHPKSPRASLLICAAFITARQIYAQAISKNPTWYKTFTPSVASGHLPIPEMLLGNLRNIANTWRPLAGAASARVSIRTVDCISAKLTETYDLILTSPPYLTRLDYVKSTLPELELLNRIGWNISIDALRLRMIGSPLVGQREPQRKSDWGPAAGTVLDEVYGHRSKASKGYYHRFYLQYFDAMHCALRNCSGALTTGGRLVLVAQTSRYKEHLIDLPLVLSEMAERNGLQLEHRQDFVQKRSIMTKNQRATSANAQVVESVIVLVKPPGAGP
jgi:hypothetical protein